MTPIQTRLSCAVIAQPALPWRRATALRAARCGRSGLGGDLGALLRLGFRGRFDRGLADRRLFDNSGIAEELGDPLGRLRPNPEPVPDALLLQRHPLGM